MSKETDAMTCTHSRTDRLNAAPRCHAKSKRSGFQCQAPAVRGKKVCRIHGARAGAPTGERNGNYRHGANTNEARALAAQARILKGISRDFLSVLSDAMAAD
ncbi:hypothetical protein [Rhizobium sp. WYCCWR10014]|uniref:hypothetical protein n=1 Tax=Rhizobium TaxID=379 RepID=UPI0012E72D26|nr:hypothetical protein [Rhizobium sp. WYCCWR10014]